jgi:hypothetical protein
MQNQLVVDLYPKTLQSGKVILNELCSCGRMITEHAGVTGHGPSLDGECPRFTWVKWIIEGEDA